MFILTKAPMMSAPKGASRSRNKRVARSVWKSPVGLFLISYLQIYHFQKKNMEAAGNIELDVNPYLPTLILENGLPIFLKVYITFPSLFSGKCKHDLR